MIMMIIIIIIIIIIIRLSQAGRGDAVRVRCTLQPVV